MVSVVSPNVMSLVPGGLIAKYRNWHIFELLQQRGPEQVKHDGDGHP
jgi:hypothetical protein